MSTAILNVWISNLGDPCSIANDIGAGIPYAWSVAVLHCDGKVANWSEGRYRLHHDENWIPIPKHTPAGGNVAGWWYEMIPTRDGHVEIELPPGCYMVVGSMHTWFVNGVLHGNWATDRAIVTACCGEDACVRLYASSMQPCNVIFHEFVIPMLIQNKVIGRQEGEAVMRAMRGLFKPEQLSDFDRGQLEMMRRAFAQMNKPSPLEPGAKGARKSGK
jgi:hypothetical protein